VSVLGVFSYISRDRKHFWRMSDYDLSSMNANVELIIYSALAFFVPLAIGHPQFVVGVLVNCAIVLSALNLKEYKLLPVIILPSLAVLSRGIIFGPFTMYLVYMIPFIWAGNFILLFAFKELKLRRKLKGIYTLAIGAISKSAVLFLSAFILVKSGILPSPFLVSMGIIQFYTAIAGGALALGIHEMKKKYFKRMNA
jgi:hypothetical protein